MDIEYIAIENRWDHIEDKIEHLKQINSYLNIMGKRGWILQTSDVVNSEHLIFYRSALKEKWYKWEPISDLDRYYYSSKIIYDEESLEIELLSEIKEEKIKIIWEKSVKTMRSANESYRTSLWDRRKNTDWSFFIVENSKLLDFFHNLSNDKYIFNDSLMHYVIMGEEIIEVVADENPKVIRILKGDSIG